jgi:predicted O-methyltransferase YrrM
MENLEKVIGSRPEAFCDSLVANRPEWVTGSLSRSDTRFLFDTALKSGASLAVEIGTASGFSTGVLCQALNVASQAGMINSDFHVFSYDVSSSFYADRNKQVGDATSEQLSPELLKHVTFRHPAPASRLEQYHRNDDIGLLLIDANHKHPWPTLDLLAALALLEPGAVVVLHDINLPLKNARFQAWGAKYLFDGLDLEKHVQQDDEVPNIGSIRIPEDKDQLRGQLLEILFAHEWQTDVSDGYLANLGITHDPPASASPGDLPAGASESSGTTREPEGAGRTEGAQQGGSEKAGPRMPYLLFAMVVAIVVAGLCAAWSASL